MRNKRTSFESNWSEENKFASNYYPINFVASDYYVFFDSLEHKSSKVAQFLYSKVLTWLYGPMRNPVMNYRGKINPKLEEALIFLENAANLEYIREEQFLKHFCEKNTALKGIIEKSLTKGADKYLNLINAINIALKGQKTYEKELKKEIDRIEKNKKRVAEDKRIWNEHKRYAGRKGKTNLTTEEYEQRNALIESDAFGDSTLNPFFNFDGKKIFDSMFKKNNDFSVITERIILKYGKELFSGKQGKLHLDKTQAVAMLKVLTQRAYEMLAIEFEDGVKKKEGESRSARKERIGRRVDSLLLKNGSLDTFYHDFTNNIGFIDTLDSIAKQNGIEPPPELVKDLKHSSKTLEERIKKIWDTEKKSGKTELNFKEWQVSHELTSKDLRQLVHIMGNVNVQAYYTNEGSAAVNFVEKGLNAAIGGGVNAPDDIEAGMLVINFDYHEATDPAKAYELVQKTKKRLSAAQMKYAQQQSKIEDNNSYVHNLSLLEKLHDEQITILKELEEELKQFGIEGENLIEHINIHNTIKGYASIDASTQKYSGAAFGSNIKNQVDIIFQTMEHGVISLPDAEWLVFALINCGEGMIGSYNKHLLEDYLSGFIGLLMFSDASFIAKDVQDYMQNGIVQSNITDIHLYTLNNKYVPSSYILHETYKALLAFANNLEEITRSTTVTLHTYNPTKTEGFEAEELYFPPGKRWQIESETALKNTKLEMSFLAGFSSLLNQLQKALPQN